MPEQPLCASCGHPFTTTPPDSLGICPDCIDERYHRLFPEEATAIIRDEREARVLTELLRASAQRDLLREVAERSGLTEQRVLQIRSIMIDRLHQATRRHRIPASSH